jgi:hypothetical protein
MSWLWYDTALENRSEEYRKKAREWMEKYHDTYSKAEDAVDLATKIATHEGDPETSLEILRDGLSMASDYTGAVPLLDDYLKLLSHGADAAIGALENLKEHQYDIYRTRRATGLSHESAVPTAVEEWADQFELRYELEQLKDEAQDMEVPETECDTCPIVRPVDKLYDCGSCDNEVCNYCISECNDDGDDGVYCSDCREECTHDGRQYCDDHLTACPADGKRYCDDYLDTCAVGGETWCLAHLSNCNDCGSLVCEEHEAVCGVCHALFGTPCLVTCQGCGEEFCEDCFDLSVEEEELAA